ncbi:type III pantothenate kinase protein [Salinisphaera shabanensis E1L3A]|uniref:Type III pantothenate kinase protein n=1 Tax=Salinisphaera shabanensis E1L3A TaxID=1033802 RepID=U2FU83_9GAMM|nr:glycosyltransferase family 4 protein [Salinisphaera shabanensis]ERJ17933.1 type III pantothenate kinase protein [Salinisphaera shabanensis E1L3A]
MTAAAFVVAGALDQPTGGYVYDRAIIDGLQADGVDIEVVELAGTFPVADDTARAALDRTLARASPRMPVIVDGLAAGGLPEVVERHAGQGALIVLLHHPLCDETGLDDATQAHLLESERRVLACATRIIVTSRFTARRLVSLALAREDAITVIEPGVRPATLAHVAHQGAPRLLCVASIIPRKGHRLLVDALAQLRDLDWVCDFVGDDKRDADETKALHQAVDRHGLSSRIRLHGSQNTQALERYYERAAIFVLASYYEGYGMVIDEAVAHGLPIVTTTGGALADTVPAGAGIVVAPGDTNALAQALHTLIDDAEQRGCAAAAARIARSRQRDWAAAAREFAAVLAR